MPISLNQLSYEAFVFRHSIKNCAVPILLNQLRYEVKLKCCTILLYIIAMIQQTKLENQMISQALVQ